MRRKSPAAERKPHPDARVEVELQRIISLRKVIARKEDLLASDHKQLDALRDTVTRHPTWDGHTRRQQQIRTLLDETQVLDAEVAKLHDDIAARVSVLTDTDLAYLEAPHA